MVRCAACGRQHVPTRDGLCPRCGAPALARARRDAAAFSSGDSSTALEFFLNAQVMIFLAITIYWLASYSGPYRTVSEWQTRTWGSYYPMLSILLLNLPFILFIQLVRKLFGLGPMPRTLGEMFPVDDRVLAVVVPLLLLVGGAAVGSWLAWSGFRAGELRPVALEDLVTGRVTDPVLYAEMRGWPDERVVSIRDGNGPTLLYVPLRASGVSEGAVPVVAEVPESSLDRWLVPQADGDEVLVRGLAERNDVPGDVRSYLESQGVVLAEPHWLVRPRVDPDERKQAGLLVAGLGLLLAGVFYVLARRALARRAFG